MARKAKTTYNIERRVAVWVSVDIEADSFDDAVEKAKKLPVSEFIQTTYEDGSFLDYDWLPGFGVRENW